MNSREARFVLEACGPGPLDTTDPAVAEAVQLMESDPALAAWFAESRRFDQSIAAKLRSVPVPQHLLETIMAGRSVQKPRSRPFSQRAWLAAAAALFVLVAVSAFLLSRRPVDVSLVTFRTEMAEILNGEWDHTFDLREPEFAKIRAWLETRRDAVRISVPEPLSRSRTYGCKTIRWRGRTATLVCFLPAEAGQVVHILAVDSKALLDPPSSEPQTTGVGTWNSAIWSRDGITYLALTQAPAERLARCL